MDINCKNNCQCAELIKEVLKKLDSFELHEPKKTIDDFNINTFKKASIKLDCSIAILRNAIKQGILKKDIHYRYNGRKKYMFSSSALLKIKGTL